MSNISYMQKLLKGVEVEWKTLDEVAIKISSGGTPRTSIPEYYDGDIPWLRTQEVDFGEIWDTGIKITEAGLKNSSAQWIPANCVIIAMYGATVGKIGLNKIPMTTNQACANIRFDEKIINYRYAFHFLSSQYGYIKSLGSGSQTNINAGIVKKLKIPIPTLEIQNKIVLVLDTFVALNAELNAELVMRKQQYKYYRDQLLTFEEGKVEWKTLDDLVSFRRGSFPQPYGSSIWYDGEDSMPFVQVADVSDFGFSLNKSTKQRISKLAQPKSVFVAAGTVIVSLQGTIGRVAITQYDCYVDRTLAIFNNYKEDINKKYFAYQLKSKFDIEKEYARGSTLKTITKAEFSKFQIPIPPLAEQERVVSILDKFDELSYSLTTGLPCEIALRQQQYEYYRELLLSFPKAEVADYD